MNVIVHIVVFWGALIVLAVLIFGNYRRNYTRGKCPEWMCELSFAHRGIHDESTDENSIGSFNKALELGYPIELDVRYTKDMIPMVIHDNNLLRTTGNNLMLSSLTYEQAKQLTFIKSNESIPSLEETLKLVNGRVPLLIEIKAYHFPGVFEERIMELLASYNGNYAIQSYNPLALNKVKKIDPSVTAGLLLDDIPVLHTSKRIRILKDNLFSYICRPAFITYNCALLEEHELDAFRTNDNFVYGFIFKEKDLELGNYKSTVDGIIFEQ